RSGADLARGACAGVSGFGASLARRADRNRRARGARARLERVSRPSSMRGRLTHLVDVEKVRPPMHEAAERHLAAALAGDRAARVALVRAIAPIVQVRVYRALSIRGGAARGRTIRQEVEDLTQDALVALFENDARVLHGWDQARGLSFINYVC